MLEPLQKYAIFEYYGVVTQLAATSEVVKIGFKINPVGGGRLVLLDWNLLVDDIAAGKQTLFDKYLSNDIRFRRIGQATLDGQWMAKQLSQIISTGLTVNSVGSVSLDILGADQYYEAVNASTNMTEKEKLKGVTVTRTKLPKNMIEKIVQCSNCNEENKLKIGLTKRTRDDKPTPKKARTAFWCTKGVCKDIETEVDLSIKQDGSKMRIRIGTFNEVELKRDLGIDFQW